MMKIFTRKTASVLLLLLNTIALNAAADVVSGKGSASTTDLLANKNNQVMLNWQITTTAPDWYQSDNAVVVNTVPQINLAGAINFPQSAESVNISGNQVKQWMQQGYKEVVLRRNFYEPAGGTNVNIDVRFSLSSSGLKAMRDDGEFIIQRLQLSFANKTNVIVVDKGEKLQAVLDVNYSGTGVFQGYWQIAELGSTEGVALYKTLKIEKSNFAKAQYSQLKSPVLPTQKPGKYLLRFCASSSTDKVLGSAGEFNCPVDRLKVVAAYQVFAGPVQKTKVISLENTSKSIAATTLLNWTDVAGAKAYQLQIFQKNVQQQAVFISGMLLPAMPSETKLTPAVASHLQKGGIYWWQVNALNKHGSIIGKSELAQFEYQP